MMRPTKFFAFLLAGTTFAATLPSQDSFYRQPENISSYKPGQIITSRKAGTNLQGILPFGPTPNVENAMQYLYRTTDSLNNPVAAVATLLMPSRNADPEKLLVFQAIYDSANNDCSPSYAWLAGANTTSAFDVVFVTSALDKGWYVLAADYQGLEAQFTAGVMAGHAVLDGVRAAFNGAGETRLSLQARYAMWGYSGGGLATEWAVELQKCYAPELHFEGAALGGLTPYIEKVIKTISGSADAGIGLAGIKGLSKAYPRLGEWLDRSIVPEKKALFEHVTHGCLLEEELGAKDLDIFSFFQQGPEVFDEPAVKEALQAGGTMGVHGIPQMPLFVYEGEKDRVEAPKDTEALVAHFCQHEGVTIQYQKARLLSHPGEDVFGSVDALPWVQDRLEGKEITNHGCTSGKVTLFGLDGASVRALGSDLAAVAADLLGSDLGPFGWG
ncbi:secretory lipase-domain-containing [Lecanosticta acicola]|uniref:Secretory lipase-domain-containing n=1 Tax=Lecanosticta acicola TaxID=111012 RepID=A0AAI9ECK9_9PEZI|nr:secretory lipase-domain-containing [Lecanosticta acicola]